jgi:hypothetical protein
MDLAGRWLIVETDLWDRETIDLVGPGFIEFGKGGTGSFGFIAVQGWMDCRKAEIEGRPGVEITWEGTDEGDQVSGRGWASVHADGSLFGHIYFHLGDDSGFRAKQVRASGSRSDPDGPNGPGPSAPSLRRQDGLRRRAGAVQGRVGDTCGESQSAELVRQRIGCHIGLPGRGRREEQFGVALAIGRTVLR